MGYRYEDMRPQLFTERGVEVLTEIRDRVRDLIERAGAVRCQEAISGATGDTWLMLACLDYLVERGELRAITAGMDVVGQHRIYVAASR